MAIRLGMFLKPQSPGGTLKLKTFGPKSFGKKTSDKKLLDVFSGISDKRLSDKYNIKKQA